MKDLIFATNNENKVLEMRSVLGSLYSIISLKEAGIYIDIPEPFDTLEANASEKSKVIFDLTKKDCFSEDTGLEITSLGGKPGVLSARYAGEKKDAHDNNLKVLDELSAYSDRSAQFRTIISLRLNGKEYKFEGICKGTILAYRQGIKGFGYDSIFIPEGSAKTFAEMDMAQKNQFSHRKIAISKMISFLRTNGIIE